MTRTGCVHGPARIHFAGADSAAERQVDPTMVQVCDDFCRPILGVHIRLPTMTSHVRGNSASQACIRAILQTTQS